MIDMQRKKGYLEEITDACGLGWNEDTHSTRLCTYAHVWINQENLIYPNRQRQKKKSEVQRQDKERN